MHGDSDDESDEEQAVTRLRTSTALQQRLQGASLQNAGAVLDVNVHRLDITILFEAEEGGTASSSSRGPRTTKSACIPACLEASFCKQAAGDLAVDVGRNLDVLEQELLALELREVATLRGWANTYMPLLRGGHQGFLLDNSTGLPEDVDLADFRRRLEDSLSKGGRGSPWSFGNALLRSLSGAACHRAELEEKVSELEKAVAIAAATRKPRASWDSVLLKEVQYVESRAPWWVDAADGLLQMLEHRGVQRGQVISIDAHTSNPDHEAAFSAHYSLELPGAGSLNIRYKRSEVDGKETQSMTGMVSDGGGPEFSWQGLYDWANREAKNRQVISLTASCARHGGGVLTCFYYKEPSKLEGVEVIEEQSTYWILAARELARALPAAGVKSGQVLWIDAHTLPGSNQVIFAAHYSRSLPDKGEMNLRCEANESKKVFKEATELHHWVCSRITQLKLSREDIVSITYTSDQNGRSTVYLFYLDTAPTSPTGSGGPPSLPLLPSVPSLRPLPQLPKEPPVVVTATRRVVAADVNRAPKVNRGIDREVMNSSPKAVISPSHQSVLKRSAVPALPARESTPVPEVPDEMHKVLPTKRVTTPPEVEDFEVLRSKVIFLGGGEQDSMPADDIDACKIFCRKQRYGAFVVTNRTAYFREETAETCAAHLVDDPRSTTYLRRGPIRHGNGGAAKTTLHMLHHSLSRAGKSLRSMTGTTSEGSHSPRVQTSEGLGSVRHDACNPTCVLQ